MSFLQFLEVEERDCPARLSVNVLLDLSILRLSSSLPIVDI